MLLVETYLGDSPGKGMGLFSKGFIKEGETIWEFVDGFDVRVHESGYAELTPVQKAFVDKYFWKEGEWLYSSCDHSVFQNHSPNPNSIPDGDRMIASRDILPDEEILVDYNAFDDDFALYKDELI